MPTGSQGWVALIVQGGAIAILGYHLLWSLPKMVSDMNRTVMAVMQMFQSVQTGQDERHERRADADRKSFDDRASSLVNKMGEFQKELPKDLAHAVSPMLEELKHQTNSIDAQTALIGDQTNTIGKQTDSINDLTQKLSDSDLARICKMSPTEKLCQAKEAMIAVGWDREKVDKVVQALERRNAKKT